MLNRLQSRRLRYAGLLMLCIGLLVVCFFVVRDLTKTSAVEVEHIPLIMRIEGKGYWQEPELRGMLLGQQLYVPVKWIQLAVLRSAHVSGNGTRLAFEQTGDAIQAQLLNVRNQRTKSNLPQGMFSATNVLISATPIQVNVSDEASDVMVSTASYFAEDTLYLPFAALSSVFGGNWRHHPDTFLIDWDEPDTVSSISAASAPVAPTGLPEPTVYPLQPMSADKGSLSESISVNEMQQSDDARLDARTQLMQTIDQMVSDDAIQEVNTDRDTVQSVPTAAAINARAVQKLLPLQGECRSKLSAAYGKAKAAATETEQNRYIAQGQRALAACDREFEEIMTELSTELVHHGYDTNVVNTYRMMYNRIKSEQRANVLE